jgi:hypothetical protein
LFVPPEAYTRIGDQPVRLRVTYSLALYRAGSPFAIPAVGARRTIAGIGDCASAEPGPFTIATGLWCFAQADTPHCFVATVRDRGTGKRNPDAGFCFPYSDYEPILARLVRLSGQSGHPVLHYNFNPPLGQPGAVLPVGPDRLAESDLIVTPYIAQTWFTRTLETPLVRLRDYAARPDNSHLQLSTIQSPKRRGLCVHTCARSQT